MSESDKKAILSAVRLKMHIGDDYKLSEDDVVTMFGSFKVPTEEELNNCRRQTLSRTGRPDPKSHLEASCEGQG